MADEYEDRKETVVVERDGDRSNTGLIVAIVIIALIILFLLFVGNPFGGGGDTDVNVDTPAPTTDL